MKYSVKVQRTVVHFATFEVDAPDDLTALDMAAEIAEYTEDPIEWELDEDKYEGTEVDEV